MKIASGTWRKEFEENGFLVVNGLISQKFMRRLRSVVDGILRQHSRLERHLKGRIQFSGGASIVTDAITNPAPPKLIGLISDLPLFGAPFQELVCHGPLLDVLESVLDGREFAFRYAYCRLRSTEDPTSIAAGEFHREASANWQTLPLGAVTIIPLEEMSSENGGTMFVRGSHRVSDEEVMAPAASTPIPPPAASEILTPRVPAGSVLFFSHKVLHAAGALAPGSHPRDTILIDWTGPGVERTTYIRKAYDGLRPRSRLPEYQRQMRMTFPRLALEDTTSA